MTMTIPLDPNPDDDDFCHDAIISGPWPNGKIMISISYNTRKRALIVLVKECKDLTAMDKNGFSDPFVKL
jgi:rabphilin-3A